TEMPKSIPRLRIELDSLPSSGARFFVLDAEGRQLTNDVMTQRSIEIKGLAVSNTYFVDVQLKTNDPNRWLRQKVIPTSELTTNRIKVQPGSHQIYVHFQGGRSPKDQPMVVAMDSWKHLRRLEGLDGGSSVDYYYFKTTDLLPRDMEYRISC